MKTPSDQGQAIFRKDTVSESKPEASADTTSDRCPTLHRFLFFAARLILGGVFIFASLDKVDNARFGATFWLA